MIEASVPARGLPRDNLRQWLALQVPQSIVSVCWFQPMSNVLPSYTQLARLYMDTQSCLLCHSVLLAKHAVPQLESR
jgi:hypothetical protein